MPYVAKHRFARIAPRKARLVIDQIRGRDVDDAITMLQFSKQRASILISKVIRSAVANAIEQADGVKRQSLFVKTAHIDPGPVIKRFQPKDRGKAYNIMKRTSHITVEVDERAEEK